MGTESVEIAVPPVTAEEIANAAPPALQARVALRNALQPLFGDGWLVTDVDRVGRTYTLSR
jgi:predicted GNAT superfamily acetyltransferase